MTRADRILIGVIASVALLSIPVVAAARSGGDRVVIEGPYGQSAYALDDDAVVSVDGREGVVTVAIHDGTVRVSDSTCPDQVCVTSGPLDDAGGVIACVPNGVTIMVGRDRDAEVLDAVNR